MIRRPLRSPLFHYTTLFRSRRVERVAVDDVERGPVLVEPRADRGERRDLRSGARRRVRSQGGTRIGIDAEIDEGDTAEDRKSTRLNSSHQIISYAVFCLKKK